MKNVGKIDKIIRYIIGIALLSLLFLINSNLRFLGLIGLVPILTAAFGFCPLYALFGINTYSTKK
ncbi:YgaP family membrane protein [Thermoanaerobacter uzonensis]|uniref:YgaP family membrane protein n=1 Tax=Thermoanaerobacter uzonensis TaxID=447593 RepID=UPI003D769995